MSHPVYNDFITEDDSNEKPASLGIIRFPATALKSCSSRDCLPRDKPWKWPKRTIIVTQTLHRQFHNPHQFMILGVICECDISISKPHVNIVHVRRVFSWKYRSNTARASCSFFCFVSFSCVIFRYAGD